MNKKLACNRIVCLLVSLLLLSSCGSQGQQPTTTAQTALTTSAPEQPSATAEPTTAAPTSSPYAGMTDAQKLIAVKTWEKEGFPQNHMVFEKDGKGILHNYDIDYRMTWSLSNNVLTTKVYVTADIAETVIYTLKMQDDSFVITNKEKNTSARFFIKGTQSTTLPAGGQKDPAVFGKWVPEDKELYGFILADDNGKSGKFSSHDEKQTILSELRWTVYDYEIYIFLANGTQYIYEYMVSGDTLIFYRPGQSNLVYKRVA